MKAKTIAKRIRARARQLHERAATFTNGDQAKAERARFLAVVLLEVSEQIAPRSKKKRQKAKKAKKTKKLLKQEQEQEEEAALTAARKVS